VEAFLLLAQSITSYGCDVYSFGLPSIWKPLDRCGASSFVLWQMLKLVWLDMSALEYMLWAGTLAVGGATFRTAQACLTTSATTTCGGGGRGGLNQGGDDAARLEAFVRWHTLWHLTLPLGVVAWMTVRAQRLSAEDDDGTFVPAPPLGVSTRRGGVPSLPLAGPPFLVIAFLGIAASLLVGVGTALGARALPVAPQRALAHLQAMGSEVVAEVEEEGKEEAVVSDAEEDFEVITLDISAAAGAPGKARTLSPKKGVMCQRSNGCDGAMDAAAAAVRKQNARRAIRSNRLHEFYLDETRKMKRHRLASPLRPPTKGA